MKSKYTEGTNIDCLQTDIYHLQEDIQACDDVIEELINSNINVLSLIEADKVSEAIAALKLIIEKYPK